MTRRDARTTDGDHTGDTRWPSRDRVFRTAALLYGAGLALHRADHVRRGPGETVGALLLGIVAAAVLFDGRAGHDRRAGDAGAGDLIAAGAP